MITRIIEHYNRWQVIYGIVGGLVAVALAVWNEIPRAWIKNAWQVTDVLGWIVGALVVAVFIIGTLMFIKAIYAIGYGRTKKYYGLEETDDVDE